MSLEPLHTPRTGTILTGYVQRNNVGLFLSHDFISCYFEKVVLKKIIRLLLNSEL